MKKQFKPSAKLWAILFIGILSSTAFLLAPLKLWREITASQAQKLSLKIPSWAPLVERAQPAVVVITTEAVVEQAPLEFPGLPGPFRFFMPMPPERQRGQGSGFIINEDGYIITNQHVIAGAQKIKVSVGSNPREYSADVIGSDEPLDIALLKIKVDEKEKIKWPYLPLGDSDKLRLGDNVMALGSPLGLVQSVNVGIVSHKHRSGIRPSGRDLFVELIQLQIPINPGNSGGPVLDDAGQVVGVSESILASGQAIAFCLPINMIKLMIPQLMATGQIERAFLGVNPTDLTQEDIKEFGLPQDQTGALLVEVMPNGPAEKAGLKAMDVILEIDEQKVTDAFNLRQLTAHRGIGQNVKLKVFRKGVGYKFFNVKLERRPGPVAQTAQTVLTLDSVGIEVTNTPPEVVSEMNLTAANAGAQVVTITRRAITTLAPMDVITRVDGVSITSAESLKAIIDKAPHEKTFMMLIRRGNSERFARMQKISTAAPMK